MNSVGYENLEEKLSGNDEENVFDELMKEYFIWKRKDYAHSKELLKEIDKYFEDKNFGMFESK